MFNRKSVLMDRTDDAADILGEVSLQSFSAQPSAIGPFGASVLRWAVTGPVGFRVKLNAQFVDKTGEQIVQPIGSTIYRLSAHAGQASKSLGSVQVTVDRSSCESFEIGNPRSAIEAPVRQGIADSEDLYFRRGAAPGGVVPPELTITFSPGRIRLQMRLKKRLKEWYIPNPNVDVDLSFGLVVRDGVMVAAAEQISVDVSVPFWVWAYPGAIPGLAIAIGMAKDDARKRLHDTIQGLAQVLDAFAVRPPGKRLSTVRIDDGNNGGGVVEFTACTQDLMVRFADISQVSGTSQQGATDLDFG
jgi:hypothetical protein